MAVRLTTPQEFSTLIDKYDTWMFDCDGVLWRGDHLIDGVIDVLRFLRCRGKHHFSVLLYRSVLAIGSPSPFLGLLS